ncbi:helix-turn-helix transcriptional regulator [Yersinia massiliensis]|uniref:Transcriptional regulator n=1 Tax=Yersinia massiliensis TaxID=419257 RepID=A0ABM6V0J6_9GAMM|nr:YafY family protein [Yersinia massiliensis]AVX40262.1 transcriptional regulator [Yersinia massiliensis]QKJ10985.1 YafY family transcriptional regulator [Yersinia massiliensis]
MSRVQRLLDLMQILRSHRFPVTGAHLASELGISLRTLYRDIGILQKQGASIDGEPGLGYVLRPGFMLPPLMFSEDEIEALVLGSRWVTDRGDVKLSAAARSALTKIAAVLPNDLCNVLDATALLVGPGASVTAGDEEILQIRRAIRAECKLEVSYCNLNSVESTRTIWPFALGYFDHVRVLVAWCELRQEFRHFRTDRISSLKITEQRYPRRRQVLLKEWREIEGISPQ